MSKLYFPDITPPSYPLSVEYEDTSITSKFEDGSMQSRSKFTRSRRKWKLKWNALHEREYNALVEFVTKGVRFAAKSFYWINAATLDARYGTLNPLHETVEVRITKFDKWTHSAPQYWSGELELTEV